MSSGGSGGLIHVVVFLITFVTAVGITIPTHPQLITQLMDGNVSLASSYFGTLIGLSSFLQFLLSPFFGALSDRIGRRSTLLIQSTLMFGFFGGLALGSIQRNFTIVLIAQIFNGLSGNLIQTCMASIADLSTPERRAQNFGLAGMSVGIGYVLLFKCFNNYSDLF
jgi:DHA1 family tetracycline resistance protein-like MFS transporter